ncbi:MAG TPA: AsmA family protein, partial [Phnomibacter sp.]|nr:AsmA family protein [Phnomibacter sp.]
MEEKAQIKATKRSREGVILRTLGKALGILTLLILIIIFLIQLPYFQKIVTSQAENYLEEKFGSEVRIQGLSIAFPKMVMLRQVYFADRNGDTLFYGDQLGVNLKMFSLLMGNIKIDELLLRDITAVLSRDTAGVFNFDHFINAFGGKADAPDKNAPPSTPLSIVLQKLNMDRTNVRYRDSTTGIRGHFYIHQFRSEIGDLDFGKQVFDVKELVWHGGDVNLQMWSPPNREESSGADPGKDDINDLPSFLIRKAEITEIAFSYLNPGDGMDMVANIGALSSTGMDLRLPEQHIDLGNSRLTSSSFFYKAGKPTRDSLPTPSPNWIITSGNIQLSKSQFGYDDLTQPRQPKGLDYGHLYFSSIHLKGKELYVSGGDTVKANIEEGSFIEKSGLKVNTLATKLLYTAKGVQLKDLDLTTPFTQLKDNIEIGYESPSLVAENPGELWIDANLVNARLSHRDLLTVVPLLYQYPMFADFPNATMEVDGKVTGFLKDLSFQNVTFRGFGGTRLRASGRLTGLPDPNALSVNLTVSEMTTTGSDLLKIIPEGMVPPNITLPASMSLKGKLNGSFSGLLTMDVAVTSSMGNATIKGTMNKADDPKLATYDLQGRLDGFRAGQMIGDTSIGTVSLSFKAKGQTYDPVTLLGDYEVYLNEGHYNGTIYRDIELKAKANNGLIAGKVRSPAEAHQFEMDFDADLRGDFPALTSHLNLITIDLQQLGFSDKPFMFSAAVDMDLPRI